jgi:hypothetical protein
MLEKLLGNIVIKRSVRVSNRRKQLTKEKSVPGGDALQYLFLVIIYLVSKAAAASSTNQSN